MLLSVESQRLPPFVGIVNAVLHRTSGGGGVNEYRIVRWTLRAEEEKIFFFVNSSLSGIQISDELAVALLTLDLRCYSFGQKEYQVRIG